MTTFHLDPRPLPPTYDRVRSGELTRDRLEKVLEGEPPGEVALVVPGPPLPCGERTVRIGGHTVLHASRRTPNGVLAEFRECLDQALREFPIEPTTSDAYATIVELDALLGPQPRSEEYRALATAVRDRGHGAVWKTPRMRMLDARNLARGFRARASEPR
jgi:hypothetical protein